MNPDLETFGHLLHGTARAWRLKLDERLKPMGMTQAKWRTLLHLSYAPGAMTQAEIAARLGIEAPSMATLLQRLENEGWVTRRGALHDRRCKIVRLGQKAQRVISQINASAAELREELLADVAPIELHTCVRVLERIRHKAEKRNGTAKPIARNGHTGNGSNGSARTPRRVVANRK